LKTSPAAALLARRS